MGCHSRFVGCSCRIDEENALNERILIGFLSVLFCFAKNAFSGSNELSGRDGNVIRLAGRGKRCIVLFGR